MVITKRLSVPYGFLNEATEVFGGRIIYRKANVPVFYS